MANTVNDTLIAGDDWKAVATGIAGYITASKPCFYVISDINPTSLEKGHRLGTDDGIGYLLGNTEVLWMKSDQNCVIVHTPGDVV